MDGLTVVLTYENGTLAEGCYPWKWGDWRGYHSKCQGICQYSADRLPIRDSWSSGVRRSSPIRILRRINEEIGDADAKYKNPRNLCSGSVRQLNSQITARAQCALSDAFALVRKAEGVDFKNSRKEQFVWLKNQGFEVVDHEEVTAADLAG